MKNEMMDEESHKGDEKPQNEDEMQDGDDEIRIRKILRVRLRKPENFRRAAFMY